MPRPRETTTYPESTRVRRLLWAVVLATPYVSARAMMDGSLAPGASSPDSIWARRIAASCKYGATSPDGSMIISARYYAT